MHNRRPMSRRRILALSGGALAAGLAAGCARRKNGDIIMPTADATSTSTSAAAAASTAAGASAAASAAGEAAAAASAAAGASAADTETAPAPGRLSASVASRPRAIAFRTKGHRGGPITRLMSPGDLGEILKPFVFLDLFEFSGSAAPPMDFGWHPHSGIATVTVLLDGTSRYAETTGATGILPAGGVEWMRAGGGVWHTGTADSSPVRGFQLWVTLPPSLEDAPSASRYVDPAAVPTVGAARVILGSYGGVTSEIDAPPMTYLSVSLRDGEPFVFEPPPHHDVAFVAVMQGALRADSRIDRGELAVFEPGPKPIHFVAEGATRFVLGAAPPHRHELVLGNYSVHTSEQALQRGEAEIRRIGAQLRAQGRTSAALQRYA